jgi:hypothetical protein
MGSYERLALTAEPEDLADPTTMRTKAATMIGVLLLLATTTAIGGHSTSQIDSILLYEAGDLVYVYPVGGIQNPPGCHGSNGDYFSFSMSRPMAKEYLAALLAAQVRGAIVELWGTTSCTDQPYSETLAYLRVQR